MTQLNYGRAFISDSLGFHIIFASLGIGLPLLISILELIGIIKKDSDYGKLARKIGAGFLILFGVGTISGTIISFQLSLLWPKFMKIAGQVVSLPFTLEGFCFLIESLFIVIYFFGWDKFKKPINHWLFSIPIILASAGSGFVVITANSWMNSPAGFSIVDGQVMNVDPLKAMFNPATPTQTSHSITSSYLATFLAVGAVFAFILLKRKSEIIAKGLKVTMVLSLISIILVVFIGDLSARYIAESEPIKSAAAESLFNTTTEAPLHIGGIIDEKNQKLIGAIELKGVLSYLVYGDTSKAVRGLNDFDRSLWPSPIVHYSFQVMVGAGFAILLFVSLYFVRKKFKIEKLTYILIIVSGFLGFIAIEAGWMTTEIGRQPYAIVGYLLTKDAFTDSKSVQVFASLFPIAYLLLFIVAIISLRRYYKKHPLKESDGNDSLHN